MQAERLRNGRAGHVRVQNGGFIAATAQEHRKHRGDNGFADAAFAAYNADDAAYVGKRVEGLVQIGLFAVGAAGRTAGTIVGAGFAVFTHGTQILHITIGRFAFSAAVSLYPHERMCQPRGFVLR